MSLSSSLGGSEKWQLFSAMLYDPARTWTGTEPSSDENAPPIMLLNYHRDRLLQAAKAFRWSQAAERLDDEHKAIKDIVSGAEEAVKTASSNNASQAYKIRPVLHQDGTLEFTITPIASRTYDTLAPSSLTPTSIPQWLASQRPSPMMPIPVVVDNEPTPRSIFTSYKTTERTHYTSARDRAGIIDGGPLKEVILYNEDGEITEGSLRNVCVWREKTWVTPELDSGCLSGTVRRWMLEHGRVKEGRIMRDELKVGDWLLMSNGVEGCTIGVVVQS